MSVQTSYANSIGKGYEGMLANLSFNDVTSRAAEDAAGIGFGLVVSRGTELGTQVSLGGTEVLGISVRGESTSKNMYAQNDSVAVLRIGYIYAASSNGAVAGDIVKYNTTTGILGSGAAGAGEAQLLGAEWDTNDNVIRLVSVANPS